MLREAKRATNSDDVAEDIDHGSGNRSPEGSHAGAPKLGAVPPGLSLALCSVCREPQVDL